MALWYNLKGKNYASQSKDWWLKSYCDHWLELFKQQLSSHFAGTDGRHNAEDINYSSGVSVREAIDAETQERLSSETVLQGLLRSEASQREQSDLSLQNDLQAETAARESGDTAVQASLQSEIAQLKENGSKVLSALHDETAQRETADSVLQDAIDSEAEQRESELDIIREKTAAAEEELNSCKAALLKASSEVANAVKSTVCGEIIKTADISPIKHIMKVRLSSGRITDYSGIKLAVCRKNLFPYSSQDMNSWTYIEEYPENSDKTYCHFYDIYLPAGTYTFSAVHTGLEGWLYLQTSTDNFLSHNQYIFCEGTECCGALTYTLAEDEKCRLWYISDRPFNEVFTNVQLESGSEKTDFENPDIYISGADGTVSITSPESNMILSADTSGVSIECEYNRDINKVLADILNTALSDEEIKDWNTVQALVRAGLAPKVFSIGDQLVCNHEAYGELIWDIIGFDCDIPSDDNFSHSMTLHLHSGITSMRFGAPEALYYCSDGLLEGTYYFTIHDYAESSGGNKSYFFTLEKPVPEGGQIDFRWGIGAQASECNITTYSGRTSTEPIEAVPVTEGTEGTFLGTTDGLHENMNYATYTRFGSSNWKHSAVRQWLNSGGEAGSCSVSSCKFSRPVINTENSGFLSGIDADFLAVLGKVKKNTELNALSGGCEESDDTVFLLSRSEVYGNPSGISKPYPYYKDFSALEAAGIQSDGNRIKYSGTRPLLWWLRTPSTTSNSIVLYTNTAGGINNGNVYDTLGVVPACCIV